MGVFNADKKGSELLGGRGRSLRPVQTVKMVMMEVVLVMVRHGEADHNVTEDQRAGAGSGRIVNYVEDGEKRICDTELTETGRQQAHLVAERLKEEKIDLAAASDLRRARDTALAVASRHNNIQVHTWKSARERFFGCVEKNPKLGMKLIGSQTFVEDYIEDRSLLTWRIPEGGESVVDLRTRITAEFLPHLLSQARGLQLERPTVLVASHGLFIKELHRMLGEKSLTGRDNFGLENPVVNTAVSQYRLQVESGEIRDVKCDFYACG